MMDLVLQNVPEEMAKYLLDNEHAEIVIRELNKRFRNFEKIAVKVAETDKNNIDQPIRDAFNKFVSIRNLSNTSPVHMHTLLQNKTNIPQVIEQYFPQINEIFMPLKNLQIMSILNTALSASTLIATVAGMVIICNKLDGIDRKLGELADSVREHKELNIETDIASPCRELVKDYKIISTDLNRKKPVEKKEVENLIRGCQKYLEILYRQRKTLPMDQLLGLMFSLIPVFANSIMIYDLLFYDQEQGKYALHDECIWIFDNLLSDDFMQQIQDYLFITKKQTNRQVNEYLDCQKLLLLGYKQEIEQLVNDLATCGGNQKYNEAMKWTIQYAKQQAKGIQTELAYQYGEELAQRIIEPAFEDAFSFPM